MTTTDRSGLDAAYFDVMAEHARSHWWYRARAAWVQQELVTRSAGGIAVDVGCGVGANMRALDDVGYDAVLGLDVSSYVLRRARELGGPPLLAVASAERLPVADGAVRCVASLDVIEHLGDDVAALREYARAVEPGGHVLLMVPAYQWLFSDHDHWAGHQRRYTARRAAAVVEAAGLRVERTTYLFSFLVPAAAMLRRTPLRRWVHGTDEESSSASPALNRLLAAAARCERWVARRARIPFGLSVLVVASVPAPPAAGRQSPTSS